MSDKLRYILALNFIPNVGAVLIKHLISYTGSAEAIFSEKATNLMKIPLIGEKKARDIIRCNALEEADKELKRIEGENIKILFYLDKDYPSRLKHHADAPVLLYVKGTPKFELPRYVAVVGTRMATHYGRAMTETIVDGLQKYNAALVSGLAYGIDTTAHATALDRQIHNIAILGSGLNKVYPSANRSIAEKILNQGGLISEFPMDTGPDKMNFPTRNRIIAGMSDAVVVIESKLKGGSIITAEYANSYNKDVFAIPGKITDKNSRGCNNLIKTHKAFLCESAKDIAYIMRWEADEKPPAQMELNIDFEEPEATIFTAIKEEETMHLDRLHYVTGMSLSTVTTALLNLEFKGAIKSLPGRTYTTIR